MNAGNMAVTHYDQSKILSKALLSPSSLGMQQWSIWSFIVMRVSRESQSHPAGTLGSEAIHQPSKSCAPDKPAEEAISTRVVRLISMNKERGLPTKLHRE
jgi:hypothetical protein